MIRSGTSEAGHSNKVSAVVELASSASAELLERWPQSGGLLWLLNTELPPPLRLALCRLKLRAPEERRGFEARIRSDPDHTEISPRFQ